MPTITDHALTADAIRAMTLEDFLDHCEAMGCTPSVVLARAGL